MGIVFFFKKGILDIISELIKAETSFSVIKKLAEHSSDCAIAARDFKGPRKAVGVILIFFFGAAIVMPANANFVSVEADKIWQLFTLVEKVFYS